LDSIIENKKKSESVRFIYFFIKNIVVILLNYGYAEGRKYGGVERRHEAIG